MALPQWQSLDQIVGTLALNFVSRLDQANIVPGLEDLKPGSPFLAIFQSVGQSRMRDQQTMMEVLDANDIDSPEADLDRIGAAKNVPRLMQTFSRGTVDISDTNFVKVASKLYHGAAAPIPGTTTLYVSDASKFPASGQLYIGRGTANYEGPLNYSAVANLGASWSITLVTGTLNFHALTEVVVVAQGGDRTVSAGQVVRTPAGGSTDPVPFVTTETVVVPDGETLFQGVPIACQNPGTVGNVPKGAIKEVVSPAFDGMAATNTSAITNAQDTEDDEDYRARIKATEASIGFGTRTAIETYATGVQSPDENSRVTVANLVRRSLRPTILTIDDGSGYEEKTEGIDYEVIVDSANGGEDTFQLTFGRPVAKAAATTVFGAPFLLEAGALLAVKVGGVQFEHGFQTTDFSNIGNATAFEVVASINANPSLGFSARTVDGGSRVAIFAKAEDQDDIQVTVPFTGIDANDFLNFPTQRFDTLRLYKNDRLLQKDGAAAVVSTRSQGLWQPMATGETLIVDVDGTGNITYTFSDVDFVNAGTGYLTVSASNPLAAWAAVFNAKLPGVTTTVNGSILELTSNKGKSLTASISIDPTSTLVVKGMFAATALSATGRGLDYVLDRNYGQVELVEPLVVGDRLTAGTPFTRGYVESDSLGVSVSLAADAHLWFIVDGAAEFISTGINGTIYLAPTTSAGDPNVTITARDISTLLPVNGVFANVKVGDWYIQSDASAPLGVRGAWRVSEVDGSGSWFKVELAWASYTLSDSGATVFSYTSFVRSDASVQHVVVPAGVYTPAQLAAVVAPVGATASVVGSKLRIATNTFAVNGDIALVAQNSAASGLLLSIGLVTNNEPHIAAAESGDGEVGTPNFVVQGVSSYAAGVLTAAGALISDFRDGAIDQILFTRPVIVAPVTSRFSTLDQESVPVGAITSSSVFGAVVDPTLIVTNALFANQGDRVTGVSLYRFGPESYLNATMNQDPVGAGFSVPVFRRLVSDPVVPYGATLRLKDADLLTGGLPSTLDKAFDTTFDFSNFVLHMRARGETHAADATRSALWRLSVFTGVLPGAAVRYFPPTAAAQAVSLSRVSPDGTVNINLPSGAARSVTPAVGQVLYYASGQKAVVSAYGISSITRVGGTTVTATLTAPFSVTPGAGMPAATVVNVNITSGNFASGPKTITGTGVNTITWTEVGANVTENPSGATVGWAASPLVFTGIQAGDYTNGWSGYFTGSGTHIMNVAAVAQYGVQFVNTSGFVTGTSTVASTSDFVFYPISSSTGGVSADLTVTTLVSQVNALGGIVTGAVIGTGAGIITQAYLDDANATATLQDGILHILSSSWNGGAGNYDLTLKFSPLVASLDYPNETFRLVPTTSKNVSDFLSRPAVTGLTLGGADLARSGRAEHAQLSSTTIGSGGAVQVTGGTANDLRLSVVGAAATSGLYLKVPVRTSSDLNTVSVMTWARINTSTPVPKTLDWTAGSSLQFTAAGSKVQVTGVGTAWANPASAVVAGRWYVERHGRFVAYTVQGAPGQLAGLAAGDWVVFAGGTASLANAGTFRVVWTNGNVLWVENDSAVAEDVTIGTARFYTYDSVMPGDVFQVGTAAFGAGNQGLWVVTANDDGVGNDPGTFYVEGVLTNNGPTAVGANLALVRVVPSSPATSFGRIRSAIVDPLDPTVTNLYLDYIDNAQPALASLPAGAVVQALDRLEFDTSIVTGQDGYVHDIGLIAEVNKVLYGDESDTDTYPGVISAKEDIFIQPPLIRRIFISVAVREVSGSNTTPSVQAAIAAFVNKAGGKPVAISGYLAEAQGVPGVISVIPLDPVPTEGADTIPVQPGEKAQILDIDNDIQVSIIGA